MCLLRSFAQFAVKKLTFANFTEKFSTLSSAMKISLNCASVKMIPFATLLLLTACGESYETATLGTSASSSRVSLTGWQTARFIDDFAALSEADAQYGANEQTFSSYELVHRAIPGSSLQRAAFIGTFFDGTRFRVAGRMYEPKLGQGESTGWMPFGPYYGLIDGGNTADPGMVNAAVGIDASGNVFGAFSAGTTLTELQSSVARSQDGWSDLTNASTTSTLLGPPEPIDVDGYGKKFSIAWDPSSSLVTPFAYIGWVDAEGTASVLGYKEGWIGTEPLRLGLGATAIQLVNDGLGITAFWRGDPILSRIKRIVASGDFTCTLLEDSTFRCFGAGTSGQLGTGASANSSRAQAPVIQNSTQASALAGGTNIETGENHACAALGGGSIRCWGANASGQLGNGTATSTTAPVTFGSSLGLTFSPDLALGIAHSCAINEGTGVALCSGDNTYGQIGSGDEASTSTPVSLIFPLHHRMALGTGFSCAIDASDLLNCWGSNAYGKLGLRSSDGTALDVPVRVVWNSNSQPLTQVAQVALGVDHGCALLQNGTLACWGSNDSSQVGTGSTTTLSYTGAVEPDIASVLATGERIIQIGAGVAHSCALTDLGRVFCWGDSTYGQVGDGVGGGSIDVPTEVYRDSTTEITNAVALAVGGYHTCILNTTGGTECWGRNDVGQLGDGSTTDRLRPTTATTASQIGIAQMVAGEKHTCGLKSDGSVVCWGLQLGNGNAGDVSTATPPAGVTGKIIALAAGNQHTCGIVARTGKLVCWGLNTSGQLGNNTLVNSPPAAFANVKTDASTLLAGVVGVAAGATHTCALLTDRTVHCWGSNSQSELGNPAASTTYTLADKTVSTLTTSTALRKILAHGDRTCALTPANGLTCVGSNGSTASTNGSLGAGIVDTAGFLITGVPVPVFGMQLGVSQATLGSNHGCALLYNGSLKCWGINTFGQLGDGTVTSPQSLPVQVIDENGDAILNGARVVAGGSHTCAILSDTSGVCWGSNGAGQLGVGVTSLRELVATPMLSSDGSADFVTQNLTQLALGNDHTCALYSNQTSRCFGSRSEGQTGSGQNPALVSEEQVSPLPVVRASCQDAFDGWQTRSNCALNAAWSRGDRFQGITELTPPEAPNLVSFQAASDENGTVVATFLAEDPSTARSSSGDYSCAPASSTTSTLSYPATDQCQFRVMGASRGADGTWAGPSRVEDSTTLRLSTTHFQDSYGRLAGDPLSFVGGTEFYVPGLAYLGGGRFLTVFSLSNTLNNRSELWGRVYETAKGWADQATRIDTGASSTSLVYRRHNTLGVAGDGAGNAVIATQYLSTTGSTTEITLPENRSFQTLAFKYTGSTGKYDAGEILSGPEACPVALVYDDGSVGSNDACWKLEPQVAAFIGTQGSTEALVITPGRAPESPSRLRLYSIEGVP